MNNHCYNFYKLPVALPLMLLLAACNPGNTSAQSGQPESRDPLAAAYADYQMYCMGCHGRQMDGGSGGSLIDDEWKYGSSREAIYRSIAAGIENLGMPAYGGALSKDQINGLVDLIEAKEVPEIRRVSNRTDDRISTLDYEVGVEDWVSGLTTPWGLAFIDENHALVTEKPGPVRQIINGELQPPIEGIPEAKDHGQGGMMAVSIDPNYEENGWIYLGYTHAHPDSPRDVMTRIVRGKLDGNTWTNEEVLWETERRFYSRSGRHFGVRIVFGPDGMLYFPIGDRGNDPPRAQDVTDPAGAIHRIHPDGRIPEDNPFLQPPAAYDSIWATGVRNPQGLAFHPVTGELWEGEHGPRGGDEINIIRKGANYGWPEITYGIEYNGSIITMERVRPGMEQPVWYWRPSTALCAIDFYDGAEFPFWRNHLLAGALANQTVRLLKVQEGRVIHEEIILRDRGRVRDVVAGPDGAIYVVLNGPDKILRLTAIKERLI